MALLHVAARHLDELERLFYLGQIGVGLIGAAHIGLADDFDQRRAAAVEVHIGIAAGILEALVDALAGVVLHVNAGHANAFRGAIDHDIDVAPLGEWLVILRDLVALGQVRVEVVLAGETRVRADAAIQRQRAFDGQLHGRRGSTPAALPAIPGRRGTRWYWAALRNWWGIRRKSWSRWRAARGLRVPRQSHSARSPRAWPKQAWCLSIVEPGTMGVPHRVLPSHLWRSSSRPRPRRVTHRRRRAPFPV